MRAFVHEHIADLVGKKVVILVTQQLFSGDGARVFTDLFEDGAIEVVYAEHFNMQQNMGNIPVWSALFTPNEKSRNKDARKTETKINIVCSNIKSGKVKKRGFSKGSEVLGFIQGKPWQRKTNEVTPTRLEKMVINGIRIHEDCAKCNLCVEICPAKNLLNNSRKIEHQSKCTVCYRCVNRCPQKAITVYVHRKPKWQYYMV
jgi:ferredoxin